MPTTNNKTTITEEEIKLYGVMNMTAIINNQRNKHHNNTEKLFSIIERLGNEEALREAYKVVDESVCVKYEALVGKKTRKTKNGEIEYECYLSVYGKYAGNIKQSKALCNGYIKYNDEDFDYDKESKKFVYKYDKAIIYNKEVKIVK
jgi:hypothetical protein